MQRINTDFLQSYSLTVLQSYSLQSCSMNFNFDEKIPRDFTDCVKYDLRKQIFGREDVIPMWVADMDFAAPPAVVAALQRRVEHAVFGYAEPWPGLIEAVIDHLEASYGWRIEPDWLVWLPGLVSGLNVACRTVDGAVLTAAPVYPPFLSAPKLSGRPLQWFDLGYAEDGSGNGWHWDKNARAAALTVDTELFLLCHPHNPVGRC